MNIIDYFTATDQPHWQAQIQKSDWSAGEYLYHLLKNNSLKNLVGEKTHLFLLVDGEELLSFCTLAERDDVQPTDLTPWIGFVYTYPEHRGHRYAEKLLAHAESAAHQDGAQSVYISTNHQGLYEKFGYTFLCTAIDVGGDPTRVYKKDL